MLENGEIQKGKQTDSDNCRLVKTVERIIKQMVFISEPRKQCDWELALVLQEHLFTAAAHQVAESSCSL